MLGLGASSRCSPAGRNHHARVLSSGHAGSSALSPGREGSWRRSLQEMSLHPQGSHVRCRDEGWEEQGTVVEPGYYQGHYCKLCSWGE